MSHLHRQRRCCGQPASAASARGISLIELLVGIVVSLLAVLVITQVFLSSEKQRRIPGAGADAQINGILALDAVQRDVRQAGYGLSGGPWLGACTTGDLSEPRAVGLANLPLAPVVITAGSGSTPSDSLELLSSGRVNAAMQVKLAENHAANGDKFVVPSTLGFEVNDWILIGTKAGSTCDVFKVQAMTTASPWTLTSTGTVRAYAEGSLLSNLGASPIRRRWSVAGSSTSGFALRMTNLAVATANPASSASDDAYPEVVLLRAFYAKDTDGDGSVDLYDTSLPSSHAAWTQVIGVRLALVVRSAQWDKEEVTGAGLVWNLGQATVDGSAACAGDSDSQCLTLGLSHTVASGSNDWKHYRYRMYDALIPLRNLLWNAGQP